MKRYIRATEKSSYDYRGVTIYNKDGMWYIYTDRNGAGKMEFTSDAEAEEYIDENIVEACDISIYSSQEMAQNWDEEKKMAWGSMSGASQAAVEQAISYMDSGYSADEAVRRAVSDTNWGNAEYADEEFYQEEANEDDVRWYLQLCFGSNIWD